MSAPTATATATAAIYNVSGLNRAKVGTVITSTRNWRGETYEKVRTNTWKQVGRADEVSRHDIPLPVWVLR